MCNKNYMLSLKMWRVLVIYILIMVLSLIRAEQENNVQKPEITKLEVVNLNETEVTPNSEQSVIQRKRNSGYIYNKLNHISLSARPHFQEHQSKGQIVSKFHSQKKPFMKYRPPSHSTSGLIIQGYHAQQYQNKLHHINQQHSISFYDGLVNQEVPSPIRNVDFAEINPIASQNNEPFGMYTANYLPPQNQKLPAYSLIDNFVLQSSQSSLDHGSQNQNLMQTQNHQISDAALFLSENAQAIQQLYSAPANDQGFAPNNNQFQDIGNQNLNGQFGNFKSTLQNSQEFRSTLPSYALETLNTQETLKQIQSLEKDQLIVQLQQALSQAQTTSSAKTAERYAQNQASFIQNQEFLKSLHQQTKSQISTPQTAGFENTAFSQSLFLPGSSVNSLKKFSFNYGISTTTPITPTTTVAGMSISRPSQLHKNDDTTQTISSQSVPETTAAGSPVKIPVYDGFVPTFITDTNLVPNYDSSIFTSKSLKPIQSSKTLPTYFGIPIPTESSQKSTGLPSISSITTPLSSIPSSSTNQPGAVFTPVITPVTLPIQPIRPVATLLHPLATPIHPVVTSLLSTNPVQIYPAQAATPIVTSNSNVQHTYGIQKALINPAFYKPIKTIPVYYYSNVAYQLQKPVLPNYPWNYAPLYAQTKPT